MWQILSTFFLMGCFSFGGPIAHIGYFQAEFVQRRNWLTSEEFTDLVTLCHALPGPASSQVGMGIGYTRGGPVGALAAWLGFTLPSALMLGALAMGVGVWPEVTASWVGRALAWIAAMAVGSALWTMLVSRLGDDEGNWLRQGVALACVIGAMAAAMRWHGLPVQLLILVIGAVGGGVLGRAVPPVISDASVGGLFRGRVWLIAWGCGLLVLPTLAFVGETSLGQIADRFYRVGSLVFGGGHVVLPLLESEFQNTTTLPRDVFLSGYGAAQAVPGPMFAVAAFLGAVLTPDAPVLGGVVATLAIFAPSWFLICGFMPSLAYMRRHHRMSAALSGVHLAVIGLLAAAYFQTVWPQSIGSYEDAAIVAVATGLAIKRWVPIWGLIGLLLFAGWGMSF